MWNGFRDSLCYVDTASIMPYEMYVYRHGEEPPCKLELSYLEDTFAIAVVDTE